MKAKRESFSLNIMVVGETGLGKSTFVNSLFQTDIYKQGLNVIQPPLEATSSIESLTYELEEDGIKMLLTITDSPGFGDKCDRSKDLEPIINYIEDQYKSYYEKEKKIQERKPIHDTRVHLCFYFINPTGHSLKELDILTLQEISSRVNLIPLIAKADTLTDKEKISFKNMILDDFKKYNIPIFSVDYNQNIYSEEISKVIPFCIIGSNEFTDINGKKMRCRQYPWGVVEIENPEHSDFIYLRKILMEHLLYDLKESTHDEHYHKYRSQKIMKDDNNIHRPLSILPCDDDYDERVKGMKSSLLNNISKNEERIRRHHAEDIKQAENRFRQWEEELNKKRDQLNEELEKQRQLLEQTRLQLVQEENNMQQWNSKKGIKLKK
ncbi:unnamed protein product [Cunninghamella blakesleeana]